MVYPDKKCQGNLLQNSFIEVVIRSILVDALHENRETENNEQDS